MAQALWHVAPGRSEIRSEPVAEPRAGEVRLRALHSGISRGSEALVFSGRVPPQEHERMKAPFMGGAFPFPVKYGYANVSRVEAGEAALAGRAVFSLYPHQSLFVLPANAVIALPDNVPPARAVLAANMETALNAVWDAQPGPADRIVVVGAGVVGCLVAWLCGRMPGTQVTLCDIDPSRATIAKALGVGFAAPDQAPAIAISFSMPAALRKGCRRRLRWPATKPQSSNSAGTGQGTCRFHSAALFTAAG